MTKREHKHDLVYSVKCPEEKNSEEVYNDEISRMFSERFEWHRKDKIPMSTNTLFYFIIHYYRWTILQY